ncbi:MAG: hypothetical protein QW645_04390 [Candidatus Bathyarchaeia archaeon]
MERQRLFVNLPMDKRRMLVLKIEATKLFNILTRVKELVRGLEGLEEAGDLTIARLEEAERTLRRFVGQLENRSGHGGIAPIAVQSDSRESVLHMTALPNNELPSNWL